MLQIGYLLNLHSVWRHCKLRLFTVAQHDENNVQLKENMEKFLHLLGINAQVNVIEMVKTTILYK